MENPEISIVIPVYNTELYLKKCIESVVCQSFNSFELILVDDGSTDSSLDLCNEFALKDKRIKVIHQSNNGVSSARNLGIKYAKGFWICFIDSDDWIDENYLKSFIDVKDELDINNKKDFIIQGYKRVKSMNNILNISFHQLDFNCFLDFFLYAEQNSFLNSPCFKLFKLDIIRNNNLIFDENFTLGEDHIFTLDYLGLIDTFLISNSSGYNYRINESNNSLSTRLFDIDHFEKYISITHENRMMIANDYNAKSNDIKILNRELNKWLVYLSHSILDKRREIDVKRKSVLLKKISKRIIKSVGLPRVSFNGNLYNYVFLAVLCNKCLKFKSKVWVLDKLKMIL